MAAIKFNIDSVKNLSAYTASLILCTLILIWVMELWKADLNIPFRLKGDSILHGMYIKGLIDNGWYLHNKFVGMPTGLNLCDFPMTDNLHFFILKIISLFNPDYAFAMNIYFLLTFPLTTLTSLYVFRRFNMSFISSIVVSLLFTFLPYHFLRGETHLFLASYYIIPLMVMVILWAYTDKSFLFKYDPESGKLKFLLNSKTIASIVVCLLTASAGIYYAFFACFFLIIAGVQVVLSKREKYDLLVIEVLVALIVVGTFANILPNLAYVHRHGLNPEAAQRSPVESEMFGMKVDQLLMPVDGHRLSFIACLKEKYNEIAPLVNENASSSLGLVGGIGFILLIGRLFYRPPQKYDAVKDSLSIMNLSAVLLATIGGFGFLFALVVPGIRSYNRISVYIAFFSLFAVNLLLCGLYQKYVKTKFTFLLYSVFLALVLALGILDQTNRSMVPHYEVIKAEYASDKEFVSKIEAAVPAGAMIFQIPYIQFPENVLNNNMGDYELFRGYLHSKNLRWSYGAMKGRKGDAWQREVAQKPFEELVGTLSNAGFDGIYIDRSGYDDKGASVEAGLTKLLGEEPMVSSNNRLVFFNMVGYNNKIKENIK